MADDFKSNFILFTCSNYNYIHRDTPIWYTMFFLDLQSQTGIWGLTILLQV